MKDLIAVFTYCPDDERKRILYSLLEKIQKLRHKYEIIVVSHSPIPDISYELIDFFFFDSKNTLLTDFDQTNKFWFRDDSLAINSSLVYPYSTHLAIYRLIYFVLNFSKFFGFHKVHMIEYDIKMDDLFLIDEVNDLLQSEDNVFFGNQEWITGVYFATNIQKWEPEETLFREEFILDKLKEVENRMTEFVTPKIFGNNYRKINYLDVSKIDKNLKCQFIDQHKNWDLKWCVPLLELNTDNLYFFVFNEMGGEYIIDLFVDNKCSSYRINQDGSWFIVPIGNFNQIKSIQIFVNKKLKMDINFKETNRVSFRENNFFQYC